MIVRRIAMPLSMLFVLAACGSAGGSSTPAARTTKAVSPAATVASTTGKVPARPSGLLKLRRIGSFDSPVYVTGAPGDRSRVFVVEQTGRIRIARRGHRLGGSFLDVSGKVSCCGEQGLLSMAFAPDYARSGRFYVDYTDRSGNTNIVQYRRSGPNRANANSARRVLFQHQPEANHNGGLVKFGPDRKLYVGFGDGGGGDDQHGARGNAQSLGTLLGKVLRIAPRANGGYTVPADNPFVGRAGARREIFDYGLRNPWRFSFDRKTGDMVIGDVGQNQVEEVDFARSGHAGGINYGWRPFEGRRVNFPGESAPGAVPPVLQYSHSSGGCSITGGYVVRDPKLTGFAGRYLYGDYCDGRIRAVRVGPGSAHGDRKAAPNVPQLSSFGEDTAGHVYVVSLSGPVYRLAR